MRALVQRVAYARVRVGQEEVARIGRGLCVFVGVAGGDTVADARALADRIVHLRIFEDEAGKMNRSLLEVGGGVLVVSQFTLMADTRRGRRPSFVAAAGPEQAEPLVAEVAERARSFGVEVACGRFREHMQVELCNDGPVTVLLDTAERRSG